MESGASELIQTHLQTSIIGVSGGGGDDVISSRGCHVSNSIITSVQSSFTFPSVSSVAAVVTAATAKSPLVSKDSPESSSGHNSSGGRDLPKLISKENYHHHFQSVPPSSSPTSHPHSVIVENGIFSSRAEASLISGVIDSGSGSESSSLQPPLHSANGTPMCIKRGPGRPRKDGAPASKCSNSLNKFKKFCGGNYVSGNVRGVRGGRKKIDASSITFPSSGSGSLSDLGIIDGEIGTFTEDTMGSDTSSVASSFDKLLEDFTFSELWPGKVCGFCNLGEKSMSGQGELLRLEIPLGFDPQGIFKALLDMKVIEIGESEKNLSKDILQAKRAKAIGKIKRLTSQGSLESMNEPVDEVVGYPEETTDLSLVFDQPAGHFFVHSGCARWCHNVLTSGEKGVVSGSSFRHLEKELIRALSQRCSHCGNLGAGVVCTVTNCSSFLHLPCAAASGAFQETNSLKTICSSHLDMVVSLVGNSSFCTVCDEQDHLSSMIMCSTCGHHYHTVCMALSSDPAIRPGWQCPACKMCQVCRQPGDEGKLLACEACDKAYHIFCLRPALTALPKHSWKCKMCRVCSDCGARTPGSGPSSRWHGNYSICDSCYQQRNKGLACPLCGKAYRHVAQKLMLQCHLCKKYVHGFCDPNADLSTYQLRKELYPDYEYICIPCKAAGTGLNTSGCNPRVVSAIKKASDKEFSTSESNSLLSSNFALSQDSLVFMEEDSAGGTESSIDLIWSDKARTASIIVHDDPPPPVPVPPPPPQPLPKLSPPISTNVLPINNLIPAQQPKKRKGTSLMKGNTGKAAAKKKGKGRNSEFGRKRGPKPKMRGIFGAPGVGLQRPSSDVPKGEDEPGVENRLVLCSSKDEFVLQQDVCVMCGAYGNDLEGRLIACAQCGQCYHPYCVNVKVTKVVLEKGWRCLDCTVCEGCGQRHDEARLILCDDCDVSFHIYCMNPPLDFVPQGNWKCKWCAICTLCGSNEPGLNSSWHKNYTLCGPCNSLQRCPICSAEYGENELIIKCQNCDRWLHGSCDVILTEDEAEKCADFGYQCLLCRPREVPPPHLLPPPPVLVKNPLKSPECSRSRSSSNHVVDGVSLSSCGISHIRGLSLDQPRKKRKKLANIADMEAGILEAIESVVSGAASRNHSEGEDSQTRAEDKGDDSDKGKDGKKRRSLQKFGVGGFVARLRGPRGFKDEEIDFESQNGSGGLDHQPLEKPKRKPSRRKTKNKLVECFPAYLQEAFFGKCLMDTQQIKEEEIGAKAVEDLETSLEAHYQISTESTITLSSEEQTLFDGFNQSKKENSPNKVITLKKEGNNPSLVKSSSDTSKNQPKPTLHKSKSSGALQELLPLPGDLLDNDLVDTIMNDDITKVPDGIDDLAVTSGLVDDVELEIDQGVGTGNHKDELTDFLSSIDTGLPSMDSKDVEDIFNGVLTDEPTPPPTSDPPLFPIGGSQPPPPPTPTPIPTTGILIPQSLNASVSAPTVQGSPSLSRSNSLHNVPQGLASPLNFPPPSPYHSEYSNSPQFSPAFSEPPSPWPGQVDGEVETPGNYSQRSILKWEVDEALGPNATISAVLYANMNHPELKRDHPNWNERSKQIAKIWRSLPTDKRAPYLQKARENRAACRMQKAQQIPLENKVSPETSPGQGQGSITEGPTKGTNAMQMIPVKDKALSADAGRSCNGSGPGAVPISAPSTPSKAAFTPPPTTPTSASQASSSLTLSQSHRCFIVHINTSQGSAGSSTGGQGGQSSKTNPPKLTKVLSVAPPLAKDPPQIKQTSPPDSASSKCCSMADQQIRVLTPSEIMRTLPALSQENCGSFPLMDQEKLMPPVKTTRGETQEERHWKQLQAYRQQQAQQQQLALQEQRLQGDPKDHLLSPGKHPFPTPGMPMVHRQISGEISSMQMDHSRQPLQVSTAQHMSEGGPGSLVSPHLQSMNNTRQSFPGQMGAGQPQGIRMRPPALDMPPPSPSPHFSPKHGLNTQQQHSPSPLLCRSPMYSRVPYMHSSPRPPMTSPSTNDPYGNPPLTPQPDPYAHPPSTPRSDSDSTFSPNPTDAYGQQQKLMTEQQQQFTNSGSPNEMDGNSAPPLSSPRPPGGVPPAQETRQHLRDLLQRQQIKKMEQDGSPIPCDLGSPNGQRSIPPWPTDDWQKGSMESGKHNLSPNSPIPQNQFRHPFLPQHGRMPNSVSGGQVLPGRLSGTDFRPMGPHSPLPQAQQQVQVDPRMRLLLHQHQQQLPQQRVMNAQGHLPRNPGFPPEQQQQLIHAQQGMGQFQIRPNNGGGYDPMQQQTQRLCQMGVMESNSPVSSSMLAQQLGRPLNGGRGLQPPQSPLPCSNMLQMQGSNMSERVGADVINSSDHQELPESVTAELEKLEEEQHRGDAGVGGVESDSVELADLGMDDDELLGMGADFNILEYADPELNIVVGGEKTNILDDNLDLEEEKEEEKELKRKEEDKQDKKEERVQNDVQFNATLASVPSTSGSGSQEGLTNFSSTLPVVSKTQEFSQGPPELGGSILGPPQPPPYPVPPPPYPGPGRPPTVGGGIRNGGGGDLSLQQPVVPPVMNMSMIFKNSVIGAGGGGAPARPPLQHHLTPSIPSHAPPPSNMPSNQRRTLLLQEQPLLLEDLLEQEKREQQRQGPMLINTGAEEPLLSDFDFERLKADVLSSNNLPPSLSPPTLPGQALLPPPAQQQPMYNRHPLPSGNLAAPNNLQQTHAHAAEWTNDGSSLGHRKVEQLHHENAIGMHGGLVQGMNLPGGPPNNLNNLNNPPMRLQVPLIPPPPLPPDQPQTEQERQMALQYEQWLYHQQQVLSLHLKYFDGEVAKLRKVKKSLNSKQRQLRKNGSELNENDAMELERIVKELSGIQKQLEQARKQTRQHGTIMQDYRNKQQKRKQMMMMNQPMGPGGALVPGPPPPSQRQNLGPGPNHPSQQGMQPSPLGNPNHSPHNSTPQSPMLSPAPAMSPLTQHSPMPSPMAPSPGPGPQMVQTSPRGSLTGGMLHGMDDRPFSPNNNDPMRSLQSPGPGMMSGNRIQGTHRVGNLGSAPLMAQGQGQLRTGMGMNVGVQSQQQQQLQQQQQQRHMTFVLSNVHHRMRSSSGGPEQIRLQPRYQRLAMGQSPEMLMRGRLQMQNFQVLNSQQQQSIGKPPVPQHYNSSQRVPFPVQSPTSGGMNMRSPSPLMQIGSPPGGQMLNQNRVSPASSPMRRPSGSGSGIGSPLPDRPKSVENPLTPRSSGSGPHTPSSVSGLTSMGMEMSLNHNMDGLHFENKDSHHHQQQQYAMQYQNQNSHSEMDRGGGGGSNALSSQMIPYPVFSWYADPDRLGLKGGSPFSVVNGETHSASIHTDQNNQSDSTVDLNSENPTPTANGSISPSISAANQGSTIGESQNALLKQLLQNTGCASTSSQSSNEPARFSLSNCLPSRPISNTSPQLVHTSQLSEAATRIPQPSSISRQSDSNQQPQAQPLMTPKIEPMEQPEVTGFGIMRNVVKTEEIVIKEEEISPKLPPPPTTPTSTANPTKEIIQRKESFSSTLAETIDVVASDQTALDPAIYEARRAEDEARKARRRQYQSRRRQSTGKEPQPPKKRARKGSKVEEDYELYLETLMSQLRQLPPIGITEPDLGRNYSICGVPGMGDMSKFHTKRYSRIHGDLLGDIGNSRIRGEVDYYYTFPFGVELAEREKKVPSTQRGFYNQEFASPRMGIYTKMFSGDREGSKSRSSSPGRDCDTPDTIVSSSSPEPTNFDKHNPYAGLKYINDDEDSEQRSSSPAYEILRPIPMRPVPPRFDHGSIKQDTDKENKNSSVDVSFMKSRSGGPLRENGNVTVTLTLTSNAVDDISGILRNLANILSISSPSGLQVTDRTLTPPSANQKLGSYTYRSKDGKEAVDIQSILNGTAKFCRHCDVVVLTNIIRKKSSDLPGLSLTNAKEENGDGTEDFYFCSSTCFVQFSMSHGIPQIVEEKASTLVRYPSESDASDTNITKESTKPGRQKQPLAKTPNEIQDKSKERGGKRIKLEDGKQWKGVRYRNWTASQPVQHAKYKKPTEKELTELLFRMGITVSPPKMPEDTRQCLFCHQFGDSVSDGPARLLNLDVDKWVHLNCALWSEEVYETENGALVNVDVALKQSLSLECVACAQKGATVKCFKVRCSSAYHLGCAVKESCVFYKNKTVYCSAHIPKGEKDNELTTLAVFRRVYIQRDENRQVAAVMHHADQHHLLRVGSLIFLSVGQLLPHQLSTFHTRNYIYPIGYKIVRFYWSMIRVNKRCQYICSIHEADGKPEFRITVEEEIGNERVIKSDSAQGAWHQVLESITKLRVSSNSINVFPTFITGEDLFGLTEPAIVKVLESLPGVETLSDYHFKYGRNPLLELPLAINPTGCARSEPKLRTHFKRPHTQRTGSSRSTSTPITSSWSSDPASCPYSKQFVHSKSSQYRKMKQDWRNNVYLARSKIQGLGLYAARDIEKHTMVIEYIGEIIRSELAELREKRYEAQNRGIYMFRVDENRVIDATLCGGLARYINHSCNPNCVAEQVEVERDIRIIIFTNRRICRGEELSYDYKFEFEDDQHKIPCLCGAPNCRQWMN